MFVLLDCFDTADYKSTVKSVSGKYVYVVSFDTVDDRLAVNLMEMCNKAALFVTVDDRSIVILVEMFV